MVNSRSKKEVNICKYWPCEINHRNDSNHKNTRKVYFKQSATSETDIDLKISGNISSINVSTSNKIKKQKPNICTIGRFINHQGEVSNTRKSFEQN